MTSITYVYQAQRCLSQNSIKSCIVKVRARKERRGCGYGIEVDERFLNTAVSILEKYRIKIVEIIREI
ncbi:MAG: DUF3343 domain-containing protein [Oscillospiraceae bacterium]|nr:DUF3343 domain-containing protein [Oscillospiraceae bacterium]